MFMSEKYENAHKSIIVKFYNDLNVQKYKNIDNTMNLLVFKDGSSIAVSKQTNDVVSFIPIEKNEETPCQQNIWKLKREDNFYKLTTEFHQTELKPV